DFRHLRAFIAVAEESSVTKAAARLHISQPPLSRHIRQLEEELGITLFIRHRQGVRLTEAGHGLLEKAKVLASAASDFYETAGQTTRSEENRVRVGIDRKSTRLNSSHRTISYAVFSLKQKNL